MIEAAEPRSLTINGWNIFAHPLFLDQLEELAQKVGSAEQARLEGLDEEERGQAAGCGNDVVTKVAFELIPQDPAHPQLRQGDTLGDEYKHWFRARFLQQYRLFFRYHAETRRSCWPG